MKKLIAFGLILLAVHSSCKKDNDVGVDTEYPVIDISAADAFPIQCSEVSRGQKFTFKARFSDNVELGSYNLDIHHNFDHHTHSTEVSDCGLDNIKTPVKPLLLIKTVDIPAGQKSYTADLELEVPADVDPGDYHFMIRLTDQEGWQTIKGLSIKIK
mgnify:CR=1 FL=1